MAIKYKNIVECFSRGERYRLHQMLNLCTTIHQCVDGIEIAQNGKRCKCCLPACSKDVFGIAVNINTHQRRIPKVILNSFESHVRSIGFSTGFTDFEGLYDYVANNSGLRHKNCLLVYDFCLRMGYHLNPQILPDKYVYLFQGAKEGAKAVFGKSYRGYKLPTTMLQSALGTKLNSFEIEHLLCVCKSHLDYLGPIDKVELMNLESIYLSQKVRVI